INALTSRIKEGSDYIETTAQKLNTLGDETRTAYINQVLDLAAKVEAGTKTYEELAADADVTAALAKVKGKLGPSPEFANHSRNLKRLRGSISSDTVQVSTEDRVPEVEVTINGKLTRQMVLDSGASMVCIPADMAKDLGLVPGEKDPTIRMQLADGKVVEARQMTLNSVRVGTFTVESVECAVLPENLV